MPEVQGYVKQCHMEPMRKMLNEFIIPVTRLGQLIKVK